MEPLGTDSPTPLEGLGFRGLGFRVRLFLKLWRCLYCSFRSTAYSTERIWALWCFG